MEFDEFGNPLPIERATAYAPEPTGNMTMAPRGAAEVMPPSGGGFLTPPDAFEPISDIGGLTPPTREKSGTSSSFSGMTDAGAQQVHQFQAGLYGRDASSKKTDQMMGGRRSELNALQGQYGAANRLAKDAVSEEMEANALHAEKLAGLRDQERDFYETQRFVEEQFYLDGQQERQKYIAGYQQQLGAVRQLMAQDANPLTKMSGSKGIALGMAQAAQAMLATRGIQIDVNGQIDKWVDRELSQHQQKIQNGMQMAQTDLTLYNIARQSSADDYEARSRLRGFVIEGFKVNMLAEADRFGSDIARAQAMAKVAELDKMQAANTERIGNTYFQNWHETRKGVVTEAIGMGQLALQKRAHSLAQEKWDAEKLSAKRKAAEEFKGKVLYDYQMSEDGMAKQGGGNAVRVRRDGVSEKTWNDLQGAQAAAISLDKKIAEYERLVSKPGARPGVVEYVMPSAASPEYQRLMGLEGEINMLRTKALTGLASTGSQDAKIQAGTPPLKLLGDPKAVVGVLKQTRLGLKDQFDLQAAVYTDELEGNHPARAMRAGVTRFDADTQTVLGGELKDSRAPTATDKAMQGLTAPHSDKPADEEFLKEAGVPDAQGAWDFFRNKVGASKEGFSTKESATVGGKNVQIGADSGNVVERLFSDSIYEYFGDSNAKKIPQYAAGIAALAREARTSVIARAELQDIAFGGYRGGGSDKDVITQEFARFMARQEGVELDQNQRPAPQIPGLGTDKIFPVPRGNRMVPGDATQYGEATQFGTNPWGE